MATAATRGVCDDTADRRGRLPGRNAALESATEASSIWRSRISARPVALREVNSGPFGSQFKVYVLLVV